MYGRQASAVRGAGRFADWEAARTAERIAEIVGNLEQGFVQQATKLHRFAATKAE